MLKLVSENGFSFSICEVGLSMAAMELPWNVSPFVYYKNEEKYKHNPSYIGTTIGRLSNRVKNGKLEINNEVFQLSQNHGPHHLHGGVLGYSKATWDLEQVQNSIIGKYISKDGEDGYPGEVKNEIKFSVLGNRLVVNDLAFCESKTPLSLTHHPYISFGGSIEEINVEIFANHYLETDRELIPTGKILMEKKFENRLGVDRCYIMDDMYKTVNKMAVITHKKSGTRITISSDYPAFQVYSSLIQNDETNVKKGSFAICIEPQMVTGFTSDCGLKGFYFDGQNHYDQTIVYEFEKLG